MRYIQLILNQGELSNNCLLIAMKDSDISFLFISNAKRLYDETLSPKKYVQVCMDIKGYQDSLFV